MKTPSEASNAAEHAISEFYQGSVQKSELLERLMPETVYIPMDRPPSVDEKGNATEGIGLWLPKPDGQLRLVLVTSFPMFAPLFEDFQQYAQTFANHLLETVVVYTAPEYGLVINPRTPFEVEVSPRYAAALREAHA